jgi:DNA-binding response OmpR family regulator
MGDHTMPRSQELSGTRKRILIAEDEPGVARAINRVLTNAGFETCIASDGFWTGSLLHTFKPDLITLDLRMPGIDGLEALRFFRKLHLPFTCKILVVSAEIQERLDAALALGAHGVVPKPFDNADLLAAVRGLLDEGVA